MIGRRLILISAVLLPILFSIGCLKRKESIVVKPEGTVTVVIEYEGDKEDFDKGDAMPSPASGWKVDREVKQNDDKKEEVKLGGERTFKPGEELPGSYAAANDPDAGQYLRFPTTLTRERRKDGEYLHFRRVYEPRDWAYVQFWADEHIDDNIKELGEKKLEELSQEERVEIIKAFALVEANKQVEFARRALEECDAQWKPDHWMLARRSLLRVYEEGVDWDEIARRFSNLPEEQRDGQFERETQRLMDEAHEAIVRSLKQDAGYDAEQIARFEAANRRAERYWVISNQLGGHAFEIEVTMPGTIVASNADSEEEGTVKWEFDGRAFRDRPYELMVTSRLPLDRDE